MQRTARHVGYVHRGGPARRHVDAVNGPRCVQPAVCQNGVCTTPDPANCH